MDYIIFQAINGLAGRFTFLDHFGIFCAEYLIFIMGVFVIILFSRDKKNLKINFLKAFFSVGISYLTKVIIQLVYVRPRPFITHDIVKLIEKKPDSSFPSAHTLISFSLAFVVYHYNKKLGILFIFLASLVALGRIYTGVHYPLDIIAGIFFAWITVYLIEKINLKKVIK